MLAGKGANRKRNQEGDGMKVKNISQLRDVMIDNLEQVRNDRRMVPQAKEASNAAGKILGTIKVQLEYHKLRKDIPSIPFMDVK